MSRIKFVTSRKKDIFLYRTRVENLFINEFLPDAPGDYVKVYLYGLMYAQYDEELDSVTMARTLGLAESDVVEAYRYWKSKGLISITTSRNGEPQIEYIRRVDLMYGNCGRENREFNEDEAYSQDPSQSGNADTDPEAEAEVNAPQDSAEAIIAKLINQHLSNLYSKYMEKSGHTISRSEMIKFDDAIKVFEVDPDVLDFAIDYASGVDKCTAEYITTVARNWKMDGYNDVASVKLMLEKRSLRMDSYKKIFQAMGFNRMTNAGDREIMDRWLDELNLPLNDILDACKTCAGKREPTLQYVNKVLENRILEKGGVNTRKLQASSPAADAPAKAFVQASRGVESAQANVSRDTLNSYYEYIRTEGRRKYLARIEEVNSKIPAMKELNRIETELNNEMFQSFGTDAETRQKIRLKLQVIEEEKRKLLLANGYPEDYMERKYLCDICKDSGQTDDGRTCSCRRARAEEAYEWIQKTGNR